MGGFLFLTNFFKPAEFKPSLTTLMHNVPNLQIGPKACVIDQRKANNLKLKKNHLI